MSSEASKQQNSQPINILDLHAEILEKIARLLPLQNGSFMLVSKYLQAFSNFQPYIGCISSLLKLTDDDVNLLLGRRTTIIIQEISKFDKVPYTAWMRWNEEVALAIVRAVRHRDIMTSLGFVSCDIGQTGVKGIAEYVKGSSVLKELNLYNNRIGPEGATALADALRVNSVLTNLNLASNNLTNSGDDMSGILALAHALKSGSSVMKTITFDGEALPVKQLKGTEPVETLDLSRMRLGWLSGVVIAKLIEFNGVLTSLDVGYNHLHKEAALAIVRVVQQHNRITNLGLAGCKIGPAGAKEIAEFVKGSSVLTSLNLRSNGLDADSANLTNYGEDMSGILALADALKSGSGVLTKLDVGYNNIGSDGAEALADALRVNGVLTDLNLAENYVGPELGIAMAEALKVNGVLTNLNLAVNRLDAEAGKALADALSINGVLTALNLSYNRLDVEAGKALADALSVNGVLTSLNLCVNCLGVEGAKALAASLAVNGVLTDLNLAENYIGPELGIAMAEALKVNSVLKELKLYNNAIGPPGVTALADALRVNGVLTNLNLSSTDLTYDGDDTSGILALADALKSDSSVLKELNLSDNSIGPIGAAALADALKVNGVLTNLDVGFKNLDEEAALSN